MAQSAPTEAERLQKHTAEEEARALRRAFLLPGEEGDPAEQQPRPSGQLDRRLLGGKKRSLATPADALRRDDRGDRQRRTA